MKDKTSSRYEHQIDEELQKIVKSSPIPIYALNQDMEYTAVNKAGASLIQKGVKELLGKKITHIFPNIEQSNFGIAYKRVLQTGNPEEITEIFKIPYSKKKSIYNVQIFPYKKGILCFATDISKFKTSLDEKRTSKKELKTTRTRLNKIERNYEILIENINDFTAVINSQFKFEDINKSTHLKKLGYHPKDLLGKSTLDFVHPEDKAKITSLIKKGFKSGHARSEFRFKHKNGNWIWLEAKGKTFEDKNGDLKAIVISRDISQRRKREQQQEKYLREQKIINDTFIKLSRIRDIDIICDIVGKAVKRLNKSAIIVVSLYDRQADAITIRKTIGLSEKEEKLFKLIKDDPVELIWDEKEMGSEKDLYTSGKLECVPGGLYTLMAGKIPKRVCDKLETIFNITEVYTVGFALENKPYGGISIFIPKDEQIKHQGAIETLASHVSVLLHRRQAERQLTKTQKRYQEIFEGSRDGFVMVNEDAEIIDANKAYCEMVGYSLNELKNLESFYSITPERWHEVEKEIWYEKLMKNGYSGVYEKEYIGKDGTIFPIEIQAYTVRDEEGDLNYLWGIVRDITNQKEANRKLKESEKKYRTLFNNMSSGVAVYESYNSGENFIFRDFNLAAEEIDNIKKEQLLGKKVTEVFPKVREFGLFDVFQRVCKTGKSEYHPISKYEDGRITGWRKNYVYKLPTGEIVAVYDDVTKKRRAKQKLNESERKYRLLFETMAQGVVIQNKDGQIISANPAAEEILGVSMEDMEMRTSANPNWKSIRENGTAFPVNKHPSMIALKTGREVKNVIMGVFNPKKEEYRWLNISAVPQFQQGSDEPYQVYTTFEDITERIRTEKKLKESEKKYREIAELLPDIIYEADREGNITYVNSMGFEKFGYSEDDLEKGLKVMDLIAEEYKEKAKKSLKKLFTDQETHPTEYLMERKDTSKFYARIHSKPIFEEDKIVGIRGTVSDINKRVMAEQKIKESEAKLKHLNKLKSELLRRTSHELKTPLISIKGFSNLILELYSDNLSDEVIQYLQEINRGCDRLEAIIKRILESSQLDSGKMEIRKKEEDLAQLIEIAVNSLKGASEAKDHSIVLDIHDTMKLKIEQAKILEVIENLLSNAIKYTPSGGTITINSKKTKTHYIISVNDNGIGFTGEEKSVLFTQFGKIERYGLGYDVNIDGTGLGLYVSKKIVELHGGNIWMESKGRDQGSTFYFSLPRTI